MQVARTLLVAVVLVANSALTLFSASAAAADNGSGGTSGALFAGDLGRWLEREAIPELVTLVGRHPRFRGEQIRVVTMAGGRPTLAGSGLSHALRDRLTHQLTRVKGVQIAWQNPAGHCGVPRTSPYLLGVEIVSESRANSLVTIAIVDVEEGVWVSGGYLQWRGVLTPSERRALSQQRTAAPEGTIDSPLPSRQRQQIATVLLTNIECSLRGGLDGGVRVVAGDESDSLVNALTADIREALTRSATVSVVNEPGASNQSRGTEAEWTLELASSNDGGGAVVATLHSAAASQRLGAVYIQRPQSARLAAGTPQIPVVPAPSDLRLPLIDQLHEVPAKAGDVCYRRSAECLEVQFELTAPSYLFVLRTRPSGELSLGSCSSPRKTAGTKRYRMQIRDGGAGFYALATSDHSLARRLHRQLAAGARNCGDRSRGDWLDQLEATLAEASEPVDWQVFQIPARLGDEPPAAKALVMNRSSDPALLHSSREN